MSLKVGLWCPHGRDGLPLAARLFVEQLPGDLLAWASDAAATRGETPGDAGCDVVIVLCPAHPPQPPVWRASFRGRVLLLPGTSASWDESIATVVGSWNETTLLVDVLPDECENKVLRSLFESGRDMAWLPAARDEPVSLDDSPGWSCVDLDSEDASGSGVRISGRTVLLSRDPVASGVFLRRAAAAGAVSSVLGHAGSSVRRRHLGGHVTDHLAWQSASVMAGPRLRESLRGLSRSSTSPQQPPRPFVWTEWIAAAAAPGHTSEALTTGASAACFLALNQRMRAASGRRWPAGAPAVLDRKLPFVLYPSLVLDRGALRDMATCSPEAWWYAHLGPMLEADPAWLRHALESLATEPHAGLARLLWCAVSDGYCRRCTRTVSDAVGRAFEASLALPDRGGTDWELGRLIVLAATGRFDAAEEDVQSLRRFNPAAIVEYLGWALRAWAPAFEAGETDMLPAGAAAWWLRQAHACVEAKQAGASLLLARGSLWLGEPAAAGDHAAELGADERCQLVLDSRMRDADDLVQRFGPACVSTALPAEPGARLRALTVRALVTRDATVAAELKLLAGSAPQLFHPERPSHSRATWLAGGLHLTGAVDDAGAWIERARAQDPMAGTRLARLLGD